MVANLFSLLVLIALVVLFGWLAARAWKAKRWPLWVKWPGLVLSGLLTLLFAALVFFAGKGLAYLYRAPVPVPDITVAGTPEQIARGEYLASVSCVECHGANKSQQFPLSGLGDYSEDIGLPIGKVIASNITPGGVLADLTDGELFRLLRFGYGRNQRAPMTAMLTHREYSDEDTLALIAFLRSQAPVETETNGGTELNLLGVILFFGTGVVPVAEDVQTPIVAPSSSPTAEYGQYVPVYGECAGCHGPDMAGVEATALIAAVPSARYLVSGLSLEQFIAMMRTGLKPGNTPFPPEMPWQYAARMTDDDLAALYAYLRATP